MSTKGNVSYKTYDARGNGNGDVTSSIVGGHQSTISDYTAIVMERTRMETVVRRLTPLECERLQGFPDGWTDIGEWVDSKGKTHKDADSPRYKALGNSIAIPFWEWMAGRICAEYDDDYQVTMGSLFDGIGGFPLSFSRHGAIPVWASEIEEFPIAVTKLRFPEEVTRKIVVDDIYANRDPRIYEHNAPTLRSNHCGDLKVIGIRESEDEQTDRQ